MKKQILFMPVLAFLAVIPACIQAQNNADKVTSNHVLTDRNLMQKSYFNTASTEIFGKKCSLTLVGDMLPNFSIDEKKIPVSQLDEYATEIDSLSKIIWERQRKEVEKKNVAIEKTKQQILDDLVAKKYVLSKADVHSFYLCGDSFFVNKKEQRADVFAYFKSKYMKSDDKAFYYEKNIK